MIDKDLGGQFDALAARIQKEFPGAVVDLTLFPTGGVMLDLSRAGRLFVLSYSPSTGFGVDEVKDGEGFQLGYRFAFDTIELAGEKLRQLAASAVGDAANEATTISPAAHSGV